LNRIVLAKDNGASLSTIDLTAAAQNGAVAFATTHWSLVVTAQGESPAAREALEKLCRAYWLPIYAFVRRQGYKHEEAEDITQSFFALLLRRRNLDAVRKEKGRLRSYLLTSLKSFLASEHRRATTLKRGKGSKIVPLEELDQASQLMLERAGSQSADVLYERFWALAVMEQVMKRLKDEYGTAGNAALFDSLKQLLADDPGAPARAQIASKLGMREDAVRKAFQRFRQRYQNLLHEEISHTLALASDIEDELRHFIAVLRG